MLASRSGAMPVLVELEDRRATRTPYPALVLIDGRPAAGRDISSSGLSVFVRRRLTAGASVRLTLAGAAGSADEVGSAARVSRVEPRPEGFIVGLRFVE
jgi:hypothetical protein